MGRIIFFALLFALFVGLSAEEALTEQKFNFRKTRWGMTQEEVIASETWKRDPSSIDQSVLKRFKISLGNT